MQIGTDESYGDILEGSFSEKDRLSPSSPYSASKASADLFAFAYRRTYGVDAVVTRCTNNFGPYQFPEKLIPKAIIRALKGLKIPIYGSGRNVRDWIFVEDHCEAVAAVLQSGEPGGVYNISSGNKLDNLTLVNKILGLGGLLIQHVEAAGHDLRYSFDLKIRSLAGPLATVSTKPSRRLSAGTSQTSGGGRPLQTRRHSVRPSEDGLVMRPPSREASPNIGHSQFQERVPPSESRRMPFQFQSILSPPLRLHFTLLPSFSPSFSPSFPCLSLQN